MITDRPLCIWGECYPVSQEEQKRIDEEKKEKEEIEKMKQKELEAMKKEENKSVYLVDCFLFSHKSPHTHILLLFASHELQT